MKVQQLFYKFFSFFEEARFEGYLSFRWLYVSGIIRDFQEIAKGKIDSVVNDEICIRQNKKAANLSVNCFDDPSGNRTRVYGVRGRRLDRLTNGPVNRGDRIRTCDLCVPNAALYQTEPRLVTATVLPATQL